MPAIRPRSRPHIGRATALALAGALALGVAASATASLAATAPSDPLAGVGSLSKVTVTATIVSIDPATRHVVVKSRGQHFTLKAPAEMRNFDQLKPGQTISATYAVQTAFALSPPNGQLPPDTETTMQARAAKGELPAAVVANHIVVTAAILGIDQANHTLRVVSPQGGEVYTVDVKTAAGRAALPKLKVGDKVTAYITEGLLLAAHPT
jgi:hypothetical protein